MSKINHNRPELTYKDNFKKVWREINGVRSNEYHQTDDIEKDILSIIFKDRDQQSAWDICVRVIKSYDDEEKAFINVIGQKKQNSKENRKDIRDKLVQEHEQAKRITDQAIVKYLTAVLGPPDNTLSCEAIFNEFHRATVDAANKGSFTAMELLDRIERISYSHYNIPRHWREDY
jgi:hypothetical protein